ncbi:hypothetical protein GQ53DRAFT_649844 [Thozetella sp. PMI_491]|nr:hypothetical protein GQ53DRAFT_649844 [Thozetella sp. PMI_491]
METVIFDRSPLADYLKGSSPLPALFPKATRENMPSPVQLSLTPPSPTDEGEDQYATWAEPASLESRSDPDAPADESAPSSPQFAPVGRPTVKKRFRGKTPHPLRLDIPGARHLRSYSKAVVTRIDRADNAKFLEQFRYTIVASQLLSGHSILGPQHPHDRVEAADAPAGNGGIPTSSGLVASAVAAITVAWIINWVYSGGYAHLTKKRVLFTVVFTAVAALVGHAYIRQQWLRYLREQALAEVTTFVSRTQDMDSASSAAIALIQEVELVSRGYRISAPLPPISRLEDRSQTRRCGRLRKALKSRFVEVIQKYSHVVSIVKGYSEQLDLEKYYDIYDISDFDISDALQGFSESNFEDAESLRALKIAASRFHTIRKMFLCALLALEASGDHKDLERWSTAVEGLRMLNEVTKTSYERLRAILGEEDMFPTAATPKQPLSPGRERWRSQLRKLNSLSTGIRGLQAKITLLREESDRSLNEAEDVSELGPNLMAQYESIGQDLKLLQQAWEEGRAALASGIDRNEKRLSSISSILSPTISLSGLTTVEEGGAAEAFKALTGESPPSSSFGSPRADSDEAEVFEAVALPARPRSLLTREERLAKMKQDRENREANRERVEANKGLLRELEMVINLRPKPIPRDLRNPSTPTAGRISI